MRRYLLAALAVIVLAVPALAQPKRHAATVAAITPARLHSLVATIGLPQTAVCDPVTSTPTGGSVCLSINATTGALLVTNTGSTSLTFPYSATNTGGQTATTASVLGIGGVFYSTTPSLTGGQFATASLGSNGAFNVNLVGGTPAPWPTNAAGAGIVALDQVTANANKVTQGTSPWAVTTPAPAWNNTSGNPTFCDHSQSFSTSSSGETQLVAPSGSTVTYVCSLVISANGTTTAHLDAGTSTCGTSNVDLSGPLYLIANAGFSVINAYAIWFSAASSGVCIDNGSAVAIGGSISYHQQ